MTSDPNAAPPPYGRPPGPPPGGPEGTYPDTRAVPPSAPFGAPDAAPAGPPTQGLPPQGPQGGPQGGPPQDTRREAEPPSHPGLTPQGKVESGRVSTTWVGVIVAAVLLVLLIVFVAQNSKAVTTHFLGFNGSLSLALTILIGAVFGALLVAVPGTVRIVQLRRALKRQIDHGHRGRSGEQR